MLAESAPQIDADDRREVHLAQLQLEELIVIVQAQGDPHRYAVGIGKHGRGNVTSEDLGRAGQEHHARESDDTHILHLGKRQILQQPFGQLGRLGQQPVDEGDLVGGKGSGHGMSFRAQRPPSADSRSAMSWRR